MPTQAASHSQEETIRIAIAGPMSGRFAARGQAMTTGAALAIDIINRTGGIALAGKRTKLALSRFDDRCDRARVRAIAHTIINRGIKVVIGHGCSGTSVAAAKLYAAAGIILFSPLTRHPRLTGKGAGSTTFRLAGRNDQEGEIAGHYLVRTFPSGQIALVHDRTLAAAARARGVINILKTVGDLKPFTFTMRPGEKDYAKLVNKLMSIRPDAIYIASYPTETAILVRQLREAGVTAAIVGTSVLIDDSFRQLAGQSADGIVFPLRPRPPDFPHARVVINQLRARWSERTGTSQPQFTPLQMMGALNSFLAVQILKQSLKETGTGTPRRIAAHIAGSTFDTILGKVSFNHNGDSTLSSYVMYRWSGASITRAIEPARQYATPNPVAGNPVATDGPANRFSGQNEQSALKPLMPQ